MPGRVAIVGAGAIAVQHEGERRQANTASLRFLLQRHAPLLELRDVRFIVLRDVRNVDPARVQTRTRGVRPAEIRKVVREAVGAARRIKRRASA